MPKRSIASVLKFLWKDLPRLVGKDWEKLRKELEKLLRELEKPGADRGQLEEEIFDLLAPYPEAQSAIGREMKRGSSAKMAAKPEKDVSGDDDEDEEDDEEEGEPEGAQPESMDDLSGLGGLGTLGHGAGGGSGSGYGSGAGRIGSASRDEKRAARPARARMDDTLGSFSPASAAAAPALDDSTLSAPSTPDAAAPAGTVRPSGAAKHVEVPVFFGTDRARGPEGDPEKAFLNDRGPDDLSLGLAKVAIPDSHRVGEIEAPLGFWKIRLDFNPDKHVTLLSVEVLDRAHFLQKTKEALTGASLKEALVFIHGYNVGFRDALRQAAQLSFDLKFPGLALAYCWPSEDQLVKYTVDEDTVQWTQPHFQEFLRLVRCDLGVESIHVVAHSMGNRALVETLDRVRPGDLPASAARLANVVFAAPDVGSERFRQLVKLFQGRAERFTLYASSKDKALETSQKIHGYPRAGDAGDGLVVLRPFIDTVDATHVDTSFVGHSYISGSRSVVADLFDLLRNRLPPDLRPQIKPQKRGDLPYWVFPP
jgi:esterase/lipase superfamily enzyme